MANNARIVHAKTARATVGTDAQRVYGSDWNADHILTGLESVDNTSDANKPISTATQTALNLKANTADLGSAAFVATTAFDAAGTATTAIASHVAAADPHPQYLTATEGNAAYQPLDGDLTAVAALASTGYAKRTGTNTWSLSTTIPNGDLNNSSMTLGGKSVSLGGSLEMNTIAFSGSLSADQTGNTVSAWNKVNLPTPATDIYSGWDGTNKRYKPPAGVYMFICNVSMDVATGSYGGCAVYLNGVVVQKNLVAAGAAIPNEVQVVAVLNMNGTTDYVEPYAFVSGGAKIYTVSSVPTLQAIRLL